MLRYRNKKKGQCSANEPMGAGRVGRGGGTNTIKEEVGERRVSR
jgi:hypothetical protein